MKKTDNLLLIVLTVLVIACNTTVEENPTTANIEKEITTKIAIKPKVVKINPDSLIVIPSKGKVVKAGIPKVVPYTGIRTIEAGTPKVVVIDKTNLKVFTPGEDGIPLPKKYTIQKQPATTDYSIQHGDTIFAPKIVQAIQPHPTPALPPRLPDAAICNIQYLDIEQGMNAAYVIPILEDQSGNLWFGTMGGGVNKYDGKSFTHYTEKEGLSNNFVWSIIEDKSGNLWFGTTGGGVSKYDGKSFTHYTEKEGLCNNDVRSILEDKSGNLWFGTEGGVNKYDGKSFTHYTEKEGLSNNFVWSIIEDKSGNLWFGTLGGGVNKYDGKSFTHYTEKEGLSNNFVWSIIEDKSGNLWFGTLGGGVSKYDGKSFTHYTEKEGLSNNFVRSILEDKSGNLWFGTWGGGVNKYDGKSFTHYTEKEGLSSNRVWSILEDKSGNLWFSTSGGGVNKYDGKSFTHYTEKEGLSHNIVWSILEDKSGNLWFGTWGGGVNKYDGKSFTHYTEKEGLSSNDVMSILEDKSGNLWFGTWDGVNKYDGKSFTHYTEKEGLCNNDVNSILEDKSGNLWFGTEGGVNKYDGKSFTHYTEKEGLSNNNVRSILEDKSGNLWFGTWGGVNKYDGKSFTHYTEKEGLSNNRVWSILEDQSGNLWFGTWGGVNKYDGKSFTHYTEKEGLSSNFVWSILEDKSGNLWVGTNKGLCYFEFLLPEENEQRNNINIKVYAGTEDGLKDLDFRSVCFDSKNRLWAGTDKGLTMLDLNKLENAIKPPSMQLNSINLEQSFIDYRMLADIKNSGNDWFIGENKNISLNKVQFTGVAKFYNYPLNLELPYYLNHITFNFSAIDWAAPHKIQYKYKLDGLDKAWSTKTNENKADYRNIPYGTYTFKVKAIGIANVWGETFEYTFTIHPPWWFTWWAYAMYVVTALLLIFLIFRWRTAKLKQRQKELEQTVKERTAEIAQKNITLEQQKEEILTTNEELEQQKEELQITLENLQKTQSQLVESEKMASLGGLVAGVAHEINTPVGIGVTAVSSLIEETRQMAELYQKEEITRADFKEYLTSSNNSAKLIQKNLERTASLVQSFKQVSVDQSTEQQREFNFKSYLGDVIRSLYPKFKERDIEINIDCDEELNLNSYPGAFAQIFTNLVLNSFTHGIGGKEKGKISINVRKSNGELEIEYGDDGKGIPVDILPKIFDPFVTSDQRKGTGLGLHIVYNLTTQKLKGTIKCESKTGEGVKFLIKLPLA